MKLRRSPTDSLTVDGHEFAVRRSTRRRTVGISVAPDGALTVAAPARCPTRMLTAVVRKKLPWVRRKLAEFAAAGPPPAPLRFTDGERLPYLGRTYRLVHLEPAGGAVPPLARRAALRRGRLELVCGPNGEARDAVVAWYVSRGRAHAERRVAAYAPHLGVAPDEVVVRDLGTRRWGVCDGRRRSVALHWELLLQAPDVVDYVVVHELAHLREPNHGAAFWRLVEGVLPDFRRRRARLGVAGFRAGRSRPDTGPGGAGRVPQADVSERRGAGS